MNLNRFGRGRGLATWAVVGVLGLAGISGCKKKEGSETSPTAAASGSAAAPAGPCQKFSAAVCEKAGAESPTCQSVTATSELLSPAACETALKDVQYTTNKLADQRKTCDQLVTKLCAEIGPETQTCNMVKEQTKNFPPERCQTMMQHTAEIVADLRKMEQANKPLSKELQAELVQGNVPAFGPENAAVTVVEFSDFQCPYCSRAADVATQIKKKYGDKVRFVFRQFPLSFHKDAQKAAEASLAAHEQGKFWEFHDQLFKNQQQLDLSSLEQHAKQAGLNVANFKKALDEDKYKSQVEKDMNLGKQVNVQGTPTMFVNGERVANPTSFEAVAQQIENALKGDAKKPG
ncbi:MAG TPA: thioredoxin domain-containing protein [Polyangiaceae bacterium]|nr:thioredoxin domain-containing protein [Polyangiaceae bacterium]